jgi:ABC-type spermidine/putrescine transport system permease subunit I
MATSSSPAALGADDFRVAGPAAPSRLSALRRRLSGPGLVLPALLVAALFSLVPLVYLGIVSLTPNREFFFGNRDYSFDNYRLIWNRYMPHVYTTIRLAVLSSLMDLVFGYPFAYILIRKVRYRELVRTMMVFPLFGPLYLAYGIFYVLLPNGPFNGLFEAIDVSGRDLLFNFPQFWVVFGLAVFTFPFMVMNIGTALSNVDPTLEEAASSLGASTRQVFMRILFPLSWGGILAGFLMCFGWNIGVFVPSMLLGSIAEQRILALTLQQQGLSQSNYGLATAMGVVLMALAFVVTWVSLRFSRGALGA